MHRLRYYYIYDSVPIKIKTKTIFFRIEMMGKKNGSRFLVYV